MIYTSLTKLAMQVAFDARQERTVIDYVKKIAENPVARAVKFANLLHNSDLSRLDTVDEKALRRVEKYKQAVELLVKDKK